MRGVSGVLRAGSAVELEVKEDGEVEGGAGLGFGAEW